MTRHHDVINDAIHLVVYFILESPDRISIGSDTGRQHSALSSQLYFTLNETLFQKRPTQTPTRCEPGAPSAVLNGRSSSYACKSISAIAFMAWFLSKYKDNEPLPLHITGVYTKHHPANFILIGPHVIWI